MPQVYSQLLNWGAPWQTTAGTALSTAATATISPQATGPKDFSVGNQYLYVGAVIRLTAHGILTTTAVSTTATIFAAAGVTPTTLATPVGITTGTTVITGIQWHWESISRITAVASTGNTISTQGRLTLGNSGGGLPANPIALTGTAAIGPLFAPNSGGETAAAIDTTVAGVFVMRGTLAGANATIQCTQFLIEHMVS
jgi:hypothetical protein